MPEVGLPGLESNPVGYEGKLRGPVRLAMARRFFDRQASSRELEEAVRRRIRVESPPLTHEESSAEALGELIRALASELKRRGIEIQAIRASAGGFNVRGFAADRLIDEWYSPRYAQLLLSSQSTNRTAE